DEIEDLDLRPEYLVFAAEASDLLRGAQVEVPVLLDLLGQSGEMLRMELSALGEAAILRQGARVGHRLQGDVLVHGGHRPGWDGVIDALREAGVAHAV